ncbi:MAG TPA: ATP-binding protein [Balneolaceae bacterium]
MSSTDKKKLVLKSSFEEMERVELFVEELQQWAGFDDDNFSRILLVLSEAVNNAITHGNRQDSGKKVFINAGLEKDILKVSIRDEGEGFDPDSLADPLKDENLLKEGGRGVYLIKQYADDVQFLKNGRELAISFRLDE